MSEPEHNDLPATTMADRLAARRERAAAAPEPATSPSTVPSASDGMADRLMARRARQESAEKQGEVGEGEGSLGKQVAREPLFVGLGIRGHHHAGAHDPEAPPVPQQESDPMNRPSRRPIGARESESPNPERSRRYRM